MQNSNKYRFLFAGGGTGGHLFPAIAVADKIKLLVPEADIMFVGTKSKIEGRIVPELGYKFSSIWISGFARKFTFNNILFPFKLVFSLIQSIIINMRFKPRVAIGTGGYVSGPAIWGASVMGAKILLLEQNSYPGVTNRLLEKSADEIHISFEESKKYFRVKDKLLLTGNPVRESLVPVNKNEAVKEFGLKAGKKTLLVLGGSLGARSINEAISASIEKINDSNIQLIWQTGSNGFEEFKKYQSENIKVYAFINKMNFAYSACDLLLARAGGITIAEFLKLGVPCILVPSPNVAENHQHHNAKSLSDSNAAILIEDKDLKSIFWETVSSVINNTEKLSKLNENALKLAKPEAATVIAEHAIKFAGAI